MPTAIEQAEPANLNDTYSKEEKWAIWSADSGFQSGPNLLQNLKAVERKAANKVKIEDGGGVNLKVAGYSHEWPVALRNEEVGSLEPFINCNSDLRFSLTRLLIYGSRLQGY